MPEIPQPEPQPWEEKPWYTSATKIVLILFSVAVTGFSGWITFTTGDIPEPFTTSLASVIAFYFGQKQLTK